MCVSKKTKKQTDPQHSVLNILTKKRVLSLSRLLHRKGQNSKSRYHPSTMTLPTPGDPSAEAFTTDKPRRPSPVKSSRHIKSSRQQSENNLCFYLSTVLITSPSCFFVFLRQPPGGKSEKRLVQPQSLSSDSLSLEINNSKQRRWILSLLLFAASRI